MQVLDRGTTQQAVENLSDQLHLPMERAAVTRFDVAQNFIVKYDVGVYCNHLGEYRRAKRLEQPDGLYYDTKQYKLVFYDKIAEQRGQHIDIPEIFQGRHLLRYEQRYIGGLKRSFGKDVTAASLYDEKFYIAAIDGWAAAYRAIKKINDITLNFKDMTRKTDYYNAGVAMLIEHLGGEMNFLQQLDEAQRRGELTAKQKNDLKRMVRDACNSNAPGLIVTNDTIQELDRQVEQIARCYR
jgi:hypothetical protein